MDATKKSSISSKSRQNGRSNNSGTRSYKPWATMIPEVLFQIFLRLELIEFCACAGVCRDWRLFAMNNRSTMLSKQQPLVVVKSKFAKKSCFLQNIFDGTRYKTLLPGLTSKWFLGLSCGYLIMLIENRICLLNLITRHEIHFPHVISRPSSEILAILFYCEEVSDTLLLIMHRDLRCLMLSRSSSPEWLGLLPIRNLPMFIDFAFFKGCVHILTTDAKIGKLRLQKPPRCFSKVSEVVELCNVKINIPESSLVPIYLVPWNDQLLMVAYVEQRGGRIIVVHKLDEGIMEWIQVDDLGDNALFLSKGSSALVNTTKCEGRSNSIYMLSGLLNDCRMYSLNSVVSIWNRPVIADKKSALQPHFWYFPHQIYDKNVIHFKEEEEEGP